MVSNNEERTNGGRFDPYIVRFLTGGIGDMVCCCEGDTPCLFWHCGRVSCNMLIGPAHFGIEMEAQECMSTGNSVYDRTGHHMLG